MAGFVKRRKVKHAFIATHDYGMGGVLYRLFAKSRAEVEAHFPAPTWTVFREGEADCPVIPPEFNILESDIDAPSPWLEAHIWQQKPLSEGKMPFYFSHVTNGRIEYFEIWAKSELEVLMRLPSLQSLTGKLQTAAMMSAMQKCDIDNLAVLLEKLL